ncbi:exodeoxyribonuclease V subunit gamma [Vibrio rumoiensis]|uniref:RecBCD enzyme subunit RecC n=1 Tax=Vibrio rumoiensis 1S-45 TaxID=1188252 RepID=A0A1E5E2U1_9VIBR|nr:exodeoxyribonuclease V subunit gamma [Vibrio rumoiensis]OEF25873.1 exodeoxyribonuclease V subunit gamma [Vibrio rumoiensis 1S-45]
MFTLYHSNQVDVLKSLLVELIRLNPLENPFEAEQILVQSPGMSQWLKMEMANEFGVAANLEFPLPATFIWNVFTDVLSDVPKRSAFNKEAMTWKLMHLLPPLLDTPEFLPLKRYLEDDDDQSKRYQLSEKIADIFDGYLVYRPEWIAAWEAGETVEELKGEHPWQPILWQALYDQTVSLGQSPYHRANLYEHFIDTLDSFVGNLVETTHLPKRLFVFGITALPPRYMDALHALGDHIDVHLMFTNPCRYYWGDVRDRKYLSKLAAQTRQHMSWVEDHSEYTGDTALLKGTIEQNEVPEYLQLHTKDAIGNSLLASMGKLGRDNLYLLSQLEANEIDAFVDIDSQGLLQQIQADILELREHQDDQQSLHTSEYKPVIEENDTTLQLHICHSPMREVEVLHDRLLAMFDADPTLKPRDIIVMVADINAYSHAIQAVFGNAPGERFIPFSISDRSVDQENPILQAFMRLLSLPRRRCQASEILELLEVPAVMSRFGMDDKEFERVSLWVQQVGIRWGLDENTSLDLSLPRQQQNTWLFGIERMLLGYAMPEELGLFECGDEIIAAFDEVQGMDAELAGKLAEFVRALQVYRDRLSHTHTFNTWQNYLLELLEDFFVVDLEGEVVLGSIRQCLHQLSEQLKDAAIGTNEEFSPKVLEQYLQNHLSNARVSQRFLAGQVNFCTLMPMRSIPFKAVCLLGMNDGLYPRTVAPEGFDLINGRTRAGDRSRRDDDRYLFLEALLSAQQYLYISYVGRSIQDNSEQEPSVLVAELLEYCQQNYALKGYENQPSDQSGLALINTFTHAHPLVPFSTRAFDGRDHALSSYAKEWLPAAKQSDLEVNPSDAPDDAIQAFFHQPLEPYLAQLELDSSGYYPLELHDLQRFWRLPVKYFFNRRLKTYFDSHQVMSAQIDDEPFLVAGLEKYQFGEQLLSHWLNISTQPCLAEFDQTAQAFIKQQHAQGQLPIASFGDLAADSLLTSVKPLAEALLPWVENPNSDLEVILDFELNISGKTQAHRLSGWLTGHYQNGLVRYRNGGVHSVNLLSNWIEHLCFNAMGHHKSTQLFGTSKGQVQHIQLQALDQLQAKQHLQTLIELYYQGMDSPLWFAPKTAFAGIEQGYDKYGAWVGFEENEEGREAKDSALNAMSKCFHDSFGSPVLGEGRETYIQRVWKKWTDNAGLALLDCAQQILKPLLDHCKDANSSEESNEQ